MDSVKMFKGYDQLNLEDPQRNPNPKSSKPFIAAISIFLFLFFTLTFAFLFPFSQSHHQQLPQNRNPNSPDSLRVICNVTRFPDSCLAAIATSSANATDPESVLALSLRASMSSVAALSSSLGTKGRALADCKEQMDDALSRLNDSLSAMAAPMTEAKIADIQTWVSAAVTDQETCLDGFEEVGDVAGGAEMKKMMKRCSEYTSNSLAIVAHLPNLLQQFHIPLH